jgi:uncharacterized tellurite resistance protein B-like protein
LLERIFTFLQSIADSGDDGPQPDEVRVAAVALCNQVMAADGEVTADEQAVVTAMMRERYGLDDKGIALLKSAGERAEKDAVDYFRFTSILKRALSFEQRIDLLGVLWDIVYADGVRNEVEDHVIWRIADLLGIESRDRVNQRLFAEERRRSSEGASEVTAGKGG